MGTRLLYALCTAFLVAGCFGSPEIKEAAEAGDLATVRRLLESGENPDSAGRFGITPIVAAAEKGHTDVVRLLLESGADPDGKAFGHPAVNLAAYDGHAEVVSLLLGAGADVLVAGSLALVVAAAEGHVEVVKLLLAAGLDADAPVRGGETALMAAVSADSGKSHYRDLFIPTGGDSVRVQVNRKVKSLRGQPAVVRLLLEYNADPLRLKQNGMTALDLARKAGRADILKLLETQSTSSDRS